LAAVERVPAESLSPAQPTQITSHRKKLTQERDHLPDRTTEFSTHDE